MRNRIEILDGFRAIAILGVMFFHFFSRWTTPIHETNIYPYNQDFNFFSHGNLGVQFFFIISGFVIYFTLENTDTIIVFWKKRIMRLFPSMLFASVITYLTFIFLDHQQLFPHSHQLWNFIPSLTFISPDLLDKFGFHSNYINGSYWSLWPEIQFYFIVSLFYFLSKRLFLINFTIFSMVVMVYSHIMINVLGTNKLQLNLPNYILEFYSNWVSGCFNLAVHLPYFFMGILFYDLFQKKRTNVAVNKWIFSISLVMILYVLYSNHLSVYRFLILFILIMLFVIFIFYPNKLKFLENKIFSKIGKSSYFLYLIHENIGILLITLFCSTIFPINLFFVLLLMMALITFSIWFTNKIDFPISNWMKKQLFSKVK
jgi:peptidoglycan/LPS O-acetylase OafA/YrhL